LFGKSRCPNRNRINKVAVAVDWTTITPNVKSNGKNKSKKKAGMSGSWSDDDYYLLEFGWE
jgi:hypothetical protein